MSTMPMVDACTRESKYLTNNEVTILADKLLY
jgi:hypothetical protein